MPVRIRNAIEGKRKRGENVKTGENEAQANGNSSSTGRWKADAQSKIVELPGRQDLPAFETERKTQETKLISSFN